MMKKLCIVIVTFALLCVSATVTFGFIGGGARAAAMGGAFTAVADDGFAPYWNPAGMTQLKAIAITGDFSVKSADPQNPDDTAADLSGFGGITTSSLAGNVWFDDR